MHPGVGLALADWLNREATVCKRSGALPYQEALDIADLILGGAE